MVDFRPFRGVRYARRAGSIANLICPPYDVISPAAERELLAMSPYNMVRMELAELEGSPPTSRYSNAAAAFRTMRDDGVLIRDEVPSYYLLRQRFVAGGGPKERLSLLGALRLEELGTNVLPHEDTAAGPKADRLALMHAAKANFSPLMMLYRDSSGMIRQALSTAVGMTPLVEFEVNGVASSLWPITNSDEQKAVAAGLAAEPVFVADGHHRYETSLTYLKQSGSGTDDSSQFVLTALIDFADPGLVILPYYRVVHGASEAQIQKLKALLGLYFVSRPAGTAPGAASALDAVVATIGQSQVALGTVEKGVSPALLTPANDIIPEPDPSASPQTQVRSVEAFVIQEMILKPVFGAGFPEHVAYVHDGTEAMTMIEAGEGQMAFFVKGLPADAFESVVGAGIRLPRKSTYFHPKLPSGLVINLLEGAL